MIRTPHLVIKSESRDSLSKYLLSNGIQTIINYPIALPFLDAYKYLNHSHIDFPNTYQNQLKILSLPNYPEITIDKLDYVIQKINQFQEHM